MNKIITIPLILAISACSTNQIKTSEAPLQIPSTYQQASTPKATLISLELPGKLRPQAKHHSIVELNGKTLINPNVTNTSKVDDSPQEGLLPRIARYLKKGIASWYGPGFHGRKTANGEIFNMYEMTAAHKTLPIPSYAEVTNLENNKTIVVRINDRGPYVGNRLLDLSYAAAKTLGIQSEGTGKVEIKAITPLQALPQIQKAAESQHKKVYLQLGSFGNQRKALKLQGKIAFNNLPKATILASKNTKNTTYKVQMGPIKSTENAEKLSYQLARIGIKTPQFVTQTAQN